MKQVWHTRPDCFLQNAIGNHESGLNMIISLVLNEIKPLCISHMDLALEIKVVVVIKKYFFPGKIFSFWHFDFLVAQCDI